MAVLATSVALVLCASPASGTFPGTNGPVYFQSNRTNAGNPEGENEIYRINADGTGLAQITNNTVHDERPAASADGTKIAFMSFRDPLGGSGEAEIMVMDSDGTNQQFLTDNSADDFSPSFTPDGSHVLYDSNVGHDFGGGTVNDNEIYSVPVGGGSATDLSLNAANDREPDACASDGRIVFDSTRGNGTLGDEDNDIWVMNANGGSPTQLTGTADGAPPPFSPNDFAPSWSPDCSEIAFISDRDGQNEVYVMDADGQNQTRITNTAAFENSPVWSPDGTLIAYTLNDGIVSQSPIPDQTPHTITSVNQDSFADWAPLPADTTPPNTSITSSPPAFTKSTSATFAFTSTEAGSTFKCKRDSAPAFTLCASPKTYTGLAQGTHTFRVKAIDSAGNPDPTPAVRTFTVDTTPPNTMITSGPSGTIHVRNVSFGFSSSETGSHFQCRLDGAIFKACTSPKSYTGLANGSHTFRVRAIDRAGNVDPTPAARTFTVQP
jgi:Tol biopolymer transport system component